MHGAHYIIKVDDDKCVAIENLMKIIEKENHPKYTYIGAYLWDAQVRAHRSIPLLMRTNRFCDQPHRSRVTNGTDPSHTVLHQPEGVRWGICPVHERLVVRPLVLAGQAHHLRRLELRLAVPNVRRMWDPRVTDLRCCWWWW